MRLFWPWVGVGNSSHLAHLSVFGPVVLLTFRSTVGDSFALREALKLPNLTLVGCTACKSTGAAGVGRMHGDDPFPRLAYHIHIVAERQQRLVPLSRSAQQLRAVEIPVSARSSKGRGRYAAQGRPHTRTCPRAPCWIWDLIDCEHTSLESSVAIPGSDGSTPSRKRCFDGRLQRTRLERGLPRPCST